MKPYALTGIILIAIGIVSLAHQGITYVAIYLILIGIIGLTH